MQEHFLVLFQSENLLITLTSQTKEIADLQTLMLALRANHVKNIDTAGHHSTANMGHLTPFPHQKRTHADFHTRHVKFFDTTMSHGLERHQYGAYPLPQRGQVAIA